jgi:nitrite reductase/ring-hydroxylating ferredoxin subunit/uncharacterized membrane protein
MSNITRLFPNRRAARAVTAAIDEVESLDALDPVVQKLGDVVEKVVPTGPVRDLLHGVPTGHPLHPVLVQAPLGAWLSAGILDLLPGHRPAARALVGAGALLAAPAALAGFVDWSRLHPPQKRIGLVHAAANVAAVGLYGLSFVQRLRGHHRSGKRLAALGLAVAATGGYLGGHLAYRQASGANHAESVPYRVPSGWHPVGELASLPERTLQLGTVGDVGVLLYRDGETVRALADACSHLGGPLHDGEVVVDAEACVSCPWHQSVFSLEDGAVVHGPATSPQPVFETRVRAGVVEVRLQPITAAARAARSRAFSR